MGVKMVRGQTVSLTALAAKCNVRTTSERLLAQARKDAKRNNLDAVAYVIRHSA